MGCYLAVSRRSTSSVHNMYSTSSAHKGDNWSGEHTDLVTKTDHFDIPLDRRGQRIVSACGRALWEQLFLQKRVLINFICVQAWLTVLYSFILLMLDFWLFFFFQSLFQVLWYYIFKNTSFFKPVHWTFKWIFYLQTNFMGEGGGAFWY